MDRRDFLWAVAAALVALGATIPGLVALFRPGFPPSWGGDAYGHLFKVWKLYHYGWRPWIEDWYSGYPFLRFYPPLSYLAAWVLSRIASDPVTGYKLLVSMVAPLSAITMYLALRILGFSRWSSLVASVVYATSPWVFRVVAPEGNLPRAFGFTVAPLVLIALYAVARSRSITSALLAGLFFALPLLAHHSLAVTITASSLGLLAAKLVYDGAMPRGPWRSSVRRLAVNLALFLLSFILVSGFWSIPFILDHSLASFTPETRGYLFRIQSVRPLQLVELGNSWGFFQGYLRLVSPIALVVVAIYARDKKLIGSALLVASLLALFSLLSLGAHGPTPWLNRLPVVSLIPPYRWLDALQPLYAFAIALLVERVTRIGPRGRPAWILLASIMILLIAVAEAQPQLHAWRAESFDKDLAAALNFIGGDPSTGWRFYQWGLEISKGSMVGYSPAIAHKPSIDGWYRQGDPLYLLHGELSWALTHDANYARSLLGLFGVKYVVVDESLKDSIRAEEILKSIGLHEVFRSGKIVVYRGNSTVLHVSTGRVLAITCSYSVIKYVFPEAEKGKSCYLDDYSLADLQGYSEVILYDYRYGSWKAWATVLEYVARGGTIVVDTYRSPDMMRMIPGTGLRSEIKKHMGILELRLWNGSILRLNLSYEGGAWVSTIYSGKCAKRLVVLGNNTVIGLEKHGQGRIYLVGLNLFYYAYYKRDKALRSLLHRILAPPREHLVLRLVSWRDGYMRIRYESSTSFSLVVAEAWYPYWRAYLDSKAIKVYREKHSLLLLRLPGGSHVVDLVFRDPFIVLRYVSLAASLAILALAVYQYVWRRGGVQHRRH